MKKLFISMMLMSPLVVTGEPVPLVFQGEPMRFTWELSTVRENGEKITTADLEKSTIYWNCTNGAKGLAEVKAPANIGVIDSSSLAGDCEFKLTITDKEGRYSGFSDSVWRFVDANPPARPAPTLLELAARGTPIQFKFL